MSREIPNYLRLHQAEQRTARRRPSELDVTSEFWRTFADTTGWAVQSQRHAAALQVRSAVGISAVMSAECIEQMPTVSRDAAEQLARAASSLTTRLADAEETIRRQEASLAAVEAARVAAQPGRERSGDHQQLADALAGILEIGAEATRSEAAGLYLLDEATSQLKLRAAWGLPASRLSDPPRQLRRAGGDLEALVGSVVTLSDAEAMPQWNSPEPFASAMCVAVAVDDTPIGTLWFWSSRPIEFTAAEKAAAKLTASNVAAR